jgi:predicted transcriptional regulator
MRALEVETSCGIEEVERVGEEEMIKEEIRAGILPETIIEDLEFIKKGIDYTSEIARQKGVIPATVGEEITKLRTLNLIRRGKRDKAQHYELTPEGEHILKKYSKILELKKLKKELEDLRESLRDEIIKKWEKLEELETEKSNIVKEKLKEVVE